MSKLVRWDVPFAGGFYPSVSAKFETTTKLSQSTMEIEISLSDGTRFQVESSKTLAFVCLDEGCAPQRDFGDAEIEQTKACAFQWLESPWINSYRGCQFDAAGEEVPLRHYFIFGGDNIVEFLCRDAPTVSQLANWR